MHHFVTIAILVILVIIFSSAAYGLTTITTKKTRRKTQNFQLHEQQSDPPSPFSPSSKREEAEILKAKAVELRLEIEEIAKQKPQLLENTNLQGSVEASPSPWITTSNEDGEQYRLYVDIGREDGSWMDPRWGASLKRIEFALDIKLLPTLAATEIAQKMVRDNSFGKSSEVFALETANFARLRGGFDRMECTNGAYRMDVTKKNRCTIRIVVEVEGTTKADQSYVYGDVFVPKGYLYFSLPYFGSIKELSRKEGLVSVRQTGWHTGWRREESRICGVFTARSLLEAQRIDPY